MLKPYKVIAIIIFLLPTLVLSESRIIESSTGVLAVYHKEKYSTFVRAESFYGYGWIDSHRIFIASQPMDSSEASSKLDVYDLNNNKKYELTELGGTGESHFDVNSNNGKVVFSDSDGIKILTIDDSNNYTINTAQSDINAIATFWIDDKNIGYLDLNNDFEFKQITIK